MTPSLSFFAGLFLVVSALLFAAGCVSSGPVRSLDIAPNDAGVAVERNADGTVTLRSLQTHAVSVVLMGGGFSGNTYTLPSFHVIVTNGGAADILFKPADVRAYAGERRVALLAPAELQERLDREDAAAGPKGGYPIARDASQPAEVRHEHHVHAGPPPGARFHELKFKVPARTVEAALQPQVLRPGEVGGGLVIMEDAQILSGLPLKIAVTVGAEQHEFLFDVRY